MCRRITAEKAQQAIEVWESVIRGSNMTATVPSSGQVAAFENIFQLMSYVKDTGKLKYIYSLCPQIIATFPQYVKFISKARTISHKNVCAV